MWWLRSRTTPSLHVPTEIHLESERNFSSRYNLSFKHVEMSKKPVIETLSFTEAADEKQVTHCFVGQILATRSPRSSIHSFIHSSIHSFIHPSIHSFILRALHSYCLFRVTLLTSLFGLVVTVWFCAGFAWSLIATLRQSAELPGHTSDQSKHCSL